MNHNQYLEKLAALEHQQWMDWASDVMKHENISSETRKRWELYMVPYHELPESIKDLDREYAQKIIDILE